MMPRHDKPPVAGRVYRDRPGAYAILLRGGRLLVTHQERPWPEFQLPGGGIDPGEQTLPALAREVREETGWSVTGLRRLGIYQRFTYMPEYDLWARKLCQVWVGRPALCLGPPAEAGHSAHWMTPAEAARVLASAGDRAFVQRFLEVSLPPRAR